MAKSPQSLRLHIGIFGRRNVGKSSLLNAITRQLVSIVSDQAGTTTDPVKKPMEILPLGPVLFIDTAGIDDSGALGDLRVKKTRQIFDRTDLGLIITDGRWETFEEALYTELKNREIPIIVVFNKCDLVPPSKELVDHLFSRKIKTVQTVATSGTGLQDFKEVLLSVVPAEYFKQRPIISDLLTPGELVLLVIPIDKEAPKGRLILPQVQTLRELLDHNYLGLVTTEVSLAEAFNSLKKPPAIVVTDSQAFKKVAQLTPREIKLTSFSILFARYKGDLIEQVKGTMVVEQLKPGDRVLIAEACSHHPIEDDIGRVKIPRWLTAYLGGAPQITMVQGHDFPEDLSNYKLVIHCGACMQNRKEVLSRILHCRRENVPVTNYGLLIAYLHGILARALEPFPEVMQSYQAGLKSSAR